MILFSCLTVILGIQLRAARELAEWDQQQLADEAGVDVGTIRRMEKSKKKPVAANTVSLDKVLRALDRRGVEFTNGGAPGVRLRPSPSNG